MPVWCAMMQWLHIAVHQNKVGATTDAGNCDVENCDSQPLHSVIAYGRDTALTQIADQLARCQHCVSIAASCVLQDIQTCSAQPLGMGAVAFLDACLNAIASMALFSVLSIDANAHLLLSDTVAVLPGCSVSA